MRLQSDLRVAIRAGDVDVGVVNSDSNGVVHPSSLSGPLRCPAGQALASTIAHIQPIPWLHRSIPTPSPSSPVLSKNGRYRGARSIVDHKGIDDIVAGSDDLVAVLQPGS